MTSNGNPTLAYLLSDTREIMHQVQSFCFTKGEKEIDLMKEYPIISTENYKAIYITHSKQTCIMPSAAACCRGIKLLLIRRSRLAF